MEWIMLLVTEVVSYNMCDSWNCSFVMLTAPFSFHAFRQPYQERTLAATEQLAQEDWHSKWVTELLRIVKLGKTVIIEDAGYPLCSSPKSKWGRVSVEWWMEAVAKYGWDVDSKSIHIVLEPWYDKQYNFVMHWNKESDKELGQPVRVNQLPSFVDLSSLPPYHDFGS